MTESLYLVIERHRRGWRGLRISRVSKRKPALARPTEQALVRLNVTIPDKILEPRTVNVEVLPEHIVTNTPTAVSDHP